MSRPSLTDTIGRLLEASEARPKVASALPARPSQPGDLLRKVAAVVRECDLADLTYEHLYAVRSGAAVTPEAPTAPFSYGEGPGAPLRKVAHALREADHAVRVKLAAQADDVVVAARALTLLRDRHRDAP